VNRLAVSLYAGWLTLLWVGIVTAGLNCFFPGLLLVVAGGISGWCFYVCSGERMRIDAASWLAIGIAVIAMGCAWPPGHVMQMQWDPAVYIQSGAVLAREGGISFDLSVFHDLPEILQELVSVTGWHQSPYSGMILNESGRVVPVFFHLFPVWVAYCFSLGGLDAALAVNIPLYGLAIMLMFALARQWFGPGWGVIAALLLAAFPAELWQSRFPTSELLAQVLLLGGWYFLDVALANSSRSRISGLLAGVSFGLAMMARFDSLLVVVPLLILLVGLWRDRVQRPVMWTVMIPMLLLVAHSFIHVSLAGSPYFPRRTWVVAGLVVAVIIVLVQIIVLLVRRSDHTWWNTLSPRLAGTCCAGWLGWMFFSWLIRPLLASHSRLVAWLPDLPAIITHSFLYRHMIGADAWNMYIIEQLAGWPLLLIGLIGVPLVLFGHARRGALPLWAMISMAGWGLLMFAIHHERALMWLSRRLIPVVVPALIIGAVSCGSAIDRSIRLRNSARQWLVVMMLLMISWGLMKPLGKVWSLREFYGTKNGYVSLAEHLDRSSIIFADHTGIGAVLRTAYGFDAFELQSPTMDRREILMYWLPALNASRPVVFITPVPVNNEQKNNYRLKGRSRFAARVYEIPKITLPEQYVELVSDFYIYEVIPYVAKQEPR